MDGAWQVFTTAHFEHKVLRWANKRLNESKLHTWSVDFMVSEFILLEQMNLNPGGQVEP